MPTQDHQVDLVVEAAWVKVLVAQVAQQRQDKVMLVALVLQI
jgi:hypothetical protein